MANATYFEFIDAVAAYYGTGSDEWLKIAQMGVTPETLPLIQQIPGVSVTLSNRGYVLGYDLSTPFESSVNPIAVVDSNIQTGVYSNGAFNAKIPGSAYTDPQTHETVFQSGVKTTAGGLTVAAVADKVHLGVMGVSLGTKLGKAIDSTLYNLDPDFWDTHYPAINPETWDSMATTEGGKTVIRSIFGLNNDNTTMYIDERFLAYTYMTMLANGAYTVGGSTATITNPSTVLSSSGSIDVPFNFNTGGASVRGATGGGTDWDVINNQSEVYHATIGLENRSPVFFSDKPFKIKTSQISPTTGEVVWSGTTNAYTFTYRGTTYYYLSGLSQWTYGNDFAYSPPPANVPLPSGKSVDATAWNIEYCIINGTTHTDTPLDGVTNNPNAGIHLNPNIIINPSTNQPVTPNDNIDDVLQALKTAYPDLFNDSVYEDIVQPDGTVDRITYSPTPFPDMDIDGNPITNNDPNIDPQTNPEINPENRTSPYLQTFTDTVTTNPVTPDTGGGEASPIVTPTGAGSSLWAIYNPTQTELNNFGAWLWSSSFVEQIKKLFNDPMQAIIGVHKVFATPSTGASANIKCGYIDSEISAKTVTSQYSNVNCGSVNLNEYFGNVFDYDPYTKVEIFLPFIGIVPLDLDYIMRSQITIKYTVDVLSGACIANIKVTRDGYGSVLFTYGGSAIVTYPISSGSYMGMISGALSLIAGVAGTVASGGVLAPAMLGAASGIGRMKTEVQHSGQFSGACGAMGGKKPYLIISRPQIRMADNVNQFEGIPSNTNMQLSGCTGYTKVKEVHLSIPGAYDSELQEIEQLLKDGVII